MLLTEGMAALGPCGLVSALLFQNWMCLGLGRSQLGLAAGKAGEITLRAVGPAQLLLWMFPAAGATDSTERAPLIPPCSLSGGPVSG